MDCAFYHPQAIVDEGAIVGEGTKIWAGTHILRGARIGRDCNIGEHCFIEGGVIVGNGVKIKNNVALYTGVVCEDNVFLGPSCVFTNVVNPRAFIERKHEFQRTIIHIGASVGANATVICGCEIGRYALVGAGAVVTRNVPDYTLVIGVPARSAGHVCECGEPLQFSGYKAICSSCGKHYRLNNEVTIVED